MMNSNLSLKHLQDTIAKDLDFSFKEGTNDQWITALSERINELINDDFPKLVAILYRLDISELNISAVLKEHPQTEAGKIIGALIIERQLQKIKTRKTFRQDGSVINESEKW